MITLNTTAKTKSGIEIPVEITVKASTTKIMVGECRAKCVRNENVILHATDAAKIFGVSFPKNISEVAIALTEPIEDKIKQLQVEMIHTSPITMTYYFGDWHRANSFLIEGDWASWGNAANPFSDERLNNLFAILPGRPGYFDPEKAIKVLGDFFQNNDPENYADIICEYKSYDDLRGSGTYLSSVEFPDFSTFEKYILLAYLPIIEKIKVKRAAYEAKKADCIEKAKTSGKPVEISSITVDCDHSVSECSTDIISTVAMPDGTVETHRIHTY